MICQPKAVAVPKDADDALVGLIIDPSPARDADIAVSRLLQSVHEGFGRVGVILGAALGHDEVQLLRRVRVGAGRYQHVLVRAGVNLYLWDLIVRCVGSIILGCGCSAGPLEPRLERRHVCLIFGAGRVRGCRHAGGRSRGSVTAVVCLHKVRLALAKCYSPYLFQAQDVLAVLAFHVYYVVVLGVRRLTFVRKSHERATALPMPQQTR